MRVQSVHIVHNSRQLYAVSRKSLPVVDIVDNLQTNCPECPQVNVLSQLSWTIHIVHNHIIDNPIISIIR